MDDDDFLPPPIDDHVAARGYAIARLGQMAIRAKDTKTKGLLHKAMDAILFTIDAPRGEVHVLSPDGTATGPHNAHNTRPIIGPKK